MVVPVAPPPIISPAMTNASELQARQTITKSEIARPVLPSEAGAKSNKAKTDKDKPQKQKKSKQALFQPDNAHHVDLSV